MRTKARVDANQSEIVAALRQCGCSVLSCAALGKGAPDILIGVFGKTFMLEIKDGSRPPSQRKLTPDEEKFRDGWKGHYRVVGNVDEALSAIGLTRG